MPQKVVWITGASAGIGCDIAKAFAKSDYIVIATGRRKSRLVSLVSEIRFAGREAYAMVCNMQSERSIVSTKKKILEKCGTIDVIVNNAGVTVFKSFVDTKPTEFDEVISINLRGYYLLTRAVLPLMIKKKSGHIINILSVAANTVFEESAAYSASKAGALAMFNCLREEVRKYNIRVTNIHPGAVDTSMWSPTARQRYAKRMMTTRELADVVLQTANQPKKVVIEDITVRPIKGDI